MDNTFTDIFSIQEDNIQENNDIISIEDMLKETKEDKNPINNVSTIEDLINKEEEKNDVIFEEEKKDVVKKRDKVLIIQIILLVLWAIITALVYFFGYDLFEPFINVS